jgi:protein-tyrosine phosphatase
LIDLHCHILPGLDDGAADWDTTLVMLAQAEEAGTETIVATPHSHEMWGMPGPCGEVIPQLVEKANALAAGAGLTLTVVPGQECLIDPALVNDLQLGTWLTLGKSNTVLLELPFTMWPPFTETLIFELQIAGYTVLLAHPERYRAVIEEPNLLLALVEKGVLTQVTSTSILGRFGERSRETARLLLENNLAHVIASDAHTTRGRHARLDKARDVAAGWIGAEAANRLVLDTPAALLAGAVPDLPEPHPVPAPRKKFLGIF